MENNKNDPSAVPDDTIKELEEKLEHIRTECNDVWVTYVSRQELEKQELEEQLSAMTKRMLEKPEGKMMREAISDARKASQGYVELCDTLDEQSKTTAGLIASALRATVTRSAELDDQLDQAEVGLKRIGYVNMRLDEIKKRECELRTARDIERRLKVAELEARLKKEHEERMQKRIADKQAKLEKILLEKQQAEKAEEKVLEKPLSDRITRVPDADAEDSVAIVNNVKPNSSLMSRLGFLSKNVPRPAPCKVKVPHVPAVPKTNIIFQDVYEYVEEVEYEDMEEEDVEYQELFNDYDPALQYQSSSSSTGRQSKIDDSEERRVRLKRELEVCVINNRTDDRNNSGIVLFDDDQMPKVPRHESPMRYVRTVDRIISNGGESRIGGEQDEESMEEESMEEEVIDKKVKSVVSRPEKQIMPASVREVQKSTEPTTERGEEKEKLPAGIEEAIHHKRGEERKNRSSSEKRVSMVPDSKGETGRCHEQRSDSRRSCLRSPNVSHRNARKGTGQQIQRQYGYRDDRRSPRRRARRSRSSRNRRYVSPYSSREYLYTSAGGYRRNERQSRYQSRRQYSRSPQRRSTRRRQESYSSQEYRTTRSARRRSSSSSQDSGRSRSRSHSSRSSSTRSSNSPDQNAKKSESSKKKE